MHQRIGSVIGNDAQYDTAVRNNIEPAIKEINALGGDIPFVFSFEDDEVDNEKAVNAYNRLKDWAGDKPLLLAFFKLFRPAQMLTA